MAESFGSNSYAPIALFVYKRLSHTINAMDSLKKNDLAKESRLFIFSDGARDEEDIEKIEAVRNYIDKTDGFASVEVIKNSVNSGLAKSVISGVDKLINEFGKVIVLEDDLETSSDFLKFMNAALNFYEKSDIVYSISGYSPPITINNSYKYSSYLIPTRSGSWGWATWKRAWNNIDWEIKDSERFFADKQGTKAFNLLGEDMTRMLKRQLEGKINSWSIRFDYHHFLHNAYCAYPVKSRVINSGMDGSGEHCAKTDFYDVNFSDNTDDVFNFAEKSDDDIINSSRAFYNGNLSYKNKIKQKIKHLLS